MAQQVRKLIALTEDPSSVPSTHDVKQLTNALKATSKESDIFFWTSRAQHSHRIITNIIQIR